MKILSIITSINPNIGGPAQGIRNSIPILKNEGIIRDVICFDDPMESFVKEANFNIYALGKGKTSWQYNSKIYEWLQKNYLDYDKIIIHGLWQFHGYAVYRFFKNITGKRPEIFIMPHGMLDPWFQKDKSRRLKAIRNEIYWKLIESKVVNFSDGLLFTCEMEKILARKTFSNYCPRNELIIGYGVLPPPKNKLLLIEKFYNTFPKLENSSFLLFLSRIDYKKGVTTLLESYLRIVQKYQGKLDEIPILVIAGPGIESHYGKTVLQFIESNILIQNRIHIVGMLQGELKWGAFYAADAFILPSFQENFGIAVAEALSCSTPVIISDQVNIWPEINDCQGGLICNITVDSLSEKLDQMLHWSESTKQSFSHNALTTFNKHFNLEKNLSNFFSNS